MCFAACANFPVARGYPKPGICSRQDTIELKSEIRSSKSETNSETNKSQIGKIQNTESEANWLEFYIFWSFGYCFELRISCFEFSVLCGLCAFARDIPSFGCGFAALGPSE
jgi:hypothetical protein